MASDGSIIIDTRVDNSRAEKDLNKLNNIADKGISKLNKAFIGATAIIAGFGITSFKVGADFESSMSQVAATMGITAEEIAKGSKEFDLLSEAAKEAGRTTQFSASQSAEALNYLALAGYDAEKAVATLPTVLNLAAAGGMELGYASDLVTDAMSALGEKAGTAEEFVDKLAKTSQKSNTSVSQLGEAILTVGGTAKMLAGGTTELNASLGILADNGIKGAEGGTALRNVILSLSAPTDKAAGMIKDLGLQVFDAEGNMRPLNETFEDLNGILGTMTEEEKINVLNNIFNKVDLKSVNALLANSGERFNELSGYIDDSAGAAANMAETMNDNLKGKIKELGSALEGLGIAFYEKFSTPAKEAVESITKTISELTQKLSNGELDNAISGIVTAIVGIGSSLLVLNIGSKIIGLIALATEAGGAFALLSGVIAGLGGPVTLIIAGISGLVAGLVTLWNTNEGFRAAVISAWENIKQVATDCWTTVCNFFTETIPSAWQSMCDFFAGVPEWFSNLWASVIDTFTQWGDNVSNFFTTTIPQWIDNITQWFGELPYKIGEKLGQVLGNITKWGIDTWSYLTTNVPKWIEGISKWFSELPNKIWTWLSNCIQKITDWGTQTYNNAKTWTSNTINGIIEYLSQLPGKMWEWLNQAITKMVLWGKDMVSKGKESASNTVNSIVDGFTALPGKMLDIGKSAVEGIWNGIQSMGSWIKDKISDFCSGIVNGFKSALKINSPAKVMYPVGEFTVQGIGVGLDKEMPNLIKDFDEQVKDLIGKMETTIGFETSKLSMNLTSNLGKDTSKVINNNNDNGVNQTIHIHEKVKTPSEQARAIKRVGRELLLGK